MSSNRRKLINRQETVKSNLDTSTPGALNDCMRIVESVVDFAIGKHRAITGQLYTPKKKMSSHSNRENSSMANEVSINNTNNNNIINSRSNQNNNKITSQQQIDTPPNSPDGSDQGSKACCFCWCCCCSCSCLTVRNEEKQLFDSIEGNKISINIEPPSIEEIRTWSESFDRLMQSPSGRYYFRDFLRSEYSEENMLFWMACEELKTEQQNPEIVEEKARLIYEDYISILSPKEVSLDSRVREVINRNMVDPSPYTFDEAQLQIYTLMHRDSYPRFLNSPIYKKLCAGETKL